MSSQVEHNFPQPPQTQQQKRPIESRLYGTVKMFRGSFGFIRTRRSDDDDVYVNAMDLSGSSCLNEGQTVSFRMETREEKGTQ